jgi:hypothetical protein
MENKVLRGDGGSGGASSTDLKSKGFDQSPGTVCPRPRTAGPRGSCIGLSASGRITSTNRHSHEHCIKAR